MKNLSRDEFLKQGAERQYGTAVMPNGKPLRLRSLTETERAVEIDGWLNRTKLKIDGQSRDRYYRCRLLQMCAVDDNGDLIFEESDIPQIAQVQCGWVARGVSEAMSLCGMDDSDVETEVKNYGTPDADSSS